MSPRKKDESVLRFVGRADYFVGGVPQSDLKVVDEPQAHDEVSPERAAELVATGLYATGEASITESVLVDKAAEQGGQGEMIANG